MRATPLPLAFLFDNADRLAEVAQRIPADRTVDALADILDLDLTTYLEN